MKIVSIVTLFVALVISATLNAQSKDFKQTVDFSAGGDLRVRFDVSKVHLTSWERNQVEVIAHIEGRTNDHVSADYARRAVEATRIEMTGDARSLTIKVNYDDVPYEEKWGGRNRVIPHIDWEIRAPRHLNLDFEIDRSEAEIRGFEGKIKLQADRTPVRTEDLAGELRLEIDRGNESRLANLRGSLNVNSDRTNLIFERLQITGDSRIEIDRGNLEMRVSGNQGMVVSMNKERRSEFKSDFAITTNGIHDDKFEGAINGGGPKLAIHSDRARVYLKND